MHGPGRSLSCERIWDELWSFAQPDVPAWMLPKTVMRAVYRLQEKA